MDRDELNRKAEDVSDSLLNRTADGLKWLSAQTWTRWAVVILTVAAVVLFIL